MQFTYALLALAAVVASSAQSLPDIPNCALSCFTAALTSDGCAGLTDFKCHCSKPALISTITPCVAKTCSAADQAKVQAAVKSTCQQAGVPINLPPVAGSTAGSTTLASSAPASTTPAASSTTPAASSPAASSTTAAASSSTTPAAEPTFTSSSTVEISPAPTTAAPAPSESANASSVTPFAGGAARVQGTLGGVAAALFAVAYYL